MTSLTDRSSSSASVASRERRDATDAPVFGNPSGRPDVPALLESFKRCSPWSGTGWNRVRFNEDTRYNRWPNQTWDCKKHGTPSKPPFPWEEASDVRAHLADDIMNGIVADCYEAAERHWLAPKGGLGDEHNYAIKLCDYIVNEWCDEEWPIQVERASQYRETYGWVPAHVRWERALALHYRKVTLEDLLTVVLDAQVAFGSNASIDSLGISGQYLGQFQQRVEKQMKDVARMKADLPRLPDQAKVVSICGLPDHSRDYVCIRRNAYEYGSAWQIVHLFFNAKKQRWVALSGNEYVNNESHPPLAYWTFGDNE